MGTIVIEEYGAAGSGKQSDAQLPNLRTILTTTVDATTSTSAENFTLQEGTSLIAVYGVENHRVSFGSDKTTTAYGFCVAGDTRYFGVEGGEPVYYRLDA